MGLAVFFVLSSTYFKSRCSHWRPAKLKSPSVDLFPLYTLRHMIEITSE
uniref:Uncharacterized protein n=1 Tax=Anguilla anguilla TaxID=7936 RepID=A0A0E9WNR9_ANGAN